MNGDTGRWLNPEERIQLITLRLQGVSVRQVSAEVATSVKTIVTLTKEFFAERAAVFSLKTDRTLSKLISRHFAVADAAAVAVEKDFELDNHQIAAKCLAKEGHVYKRWRSYRCSTSKVSYRRIVELEG